MEATGFTIPNSKRNIKSEIIRVRYIIEAIEDKKIYLCVSKEL